MKILFALITLSLLAALYAPVVSLSVLVVIFCFKKFIFKVVGNVLLAFVVLSGKLK